ncbi:hypothetical protein NL676_025169 [Syzygium grande]|nr:hypothetical protein NL676_025169 [Syzygium grande]
MQAEGKRGRERDLESERDVLNSDGSTDRGRTGSGPGWTGRRPSGGAHIRAPTVESVATDRNQRGGIGIGFLRCVGAARNDEKAPAAPSAAVVLSWGAGLLPGRTLRAVHSLWGPPREASCSSGPLRCHRHLTAEGRGA